MNDRIYQMAKKELLQILRHPTMLSIALFVPLLECLIIGQAISTDIKHISLVILDQNRSEKSRRLIDQFIMSDDYRIVKVADHREALTEMLERDQALISLEIPHGFSAAMEEGETAQAQIMVNGVDLNTAALVQGQIGRMELYLTEQFFPRSSLPDRIHIEQRIWFNEKLLSHHFYVPCLIGVVLTLITLVLTSMSIVREKEMGTIEQIFVSSIGKEEFILGKSLPFFLIGCFNLLFETVGAIYWFDLPFRGTIFFYLFVNCIYLSTVLTEGLLLSMVCRTQQQAMMGSFLLYFPTVMFSGFIFPITNMPTTVRWLTYLNPMRYYLDMIRPIFLKGVATELLWPGVAILSSMTIIMVGMTLRLLHRRNG